MTVDWCNVSSFTVCFEEMVKERGEGRGRGSRQRQRERENGGKMQRNFLDARNETYAGPNETY